MSHSKVYCNGEYVVYMRSIDGETGGVTLIAESDGLEPAEVSFTTG